MNDFGRDPGFLGFLSEMPLFFKIFGGLVFMVVAGGFLYVIVKGMTTWAKNNASEVVTAWCKVVDKRTQVWGGSGDSSANTSYFITFEFGDGNRLEMPVRAEQYGLLVAGDEGELTHQGTRFKNFSRAGVVK